MSSIDWVTVSSLATAGGTLVLAVATFASVRSANRAARAAETSMLEGLRPLVLTSRLTDAPEKVGFADDHWLRVPGGHGVAQVTDDAIYLAIAVRNVGRGLAVLNSWSVHPERISGDVDRPDVDRFRRLTRDIYIPPTDLGFWQGALRDPADEVFTDIREVIGKRQPFTVDLMYGDGTGGQRVITRFLFTPKNDDEWLTVVGRHWNLDRPEPR